MNQIDFKNTKGEWLQRSMVNGKYTWTISGVLWNNVKERCTVGSATWRDSPKYRGSINAFVGFQEFTEWNRKQVGYGLGYDLDADMLKNGTKRYSEETCLLIPSALNRFIQSYGSGKNALPQGITRDGDKFVTQCLFTNNEGQSKVVMRKSFKADNLQGAMDAYTEAKNSCAKIWYDRLNTDKYTVDQRVKDYMKNWKFEYVVGVNA